MRGGKRSAKQVVRTLREANRLPDDGLAAELNAWEPERGPERGLEPP